MTTGILGGTFNPVHNSHLYIARAFREGLGLDRVLLVPTFTPPHKAAVDLAPAEHRLAMCQIAAEGAEGLEVCGYEARRAGRSYTYRTLEHLRALWPGDELWFLMGADMFRTVQDWRSPERIFAAAFLAAAARAPGELAALKAHKGVLEAAGARCAVLEIPPRPLSSTQVRAAARAGGPIDAMVPEGVADYIRGHGLYGAGGHD